MTPFIHQSHDKFSSETVTTTDWSGNKDCSVRLRHFSSSKRDIIFLDLDFHQLNGTQPMLHQGKLFVLLNGSKRYTLTPNVRKPSTYEVRESRSWYDGREEEYVYWDEHMYYEITEDMLREMASAISIEMKVTGASVSKVIEGDEVRLSFIIMAKALYNAIFDNSSYNEELKKEKKRIKEAQIEATVQELAEEGESSLDEVLDDIDDEIYDDEDKEIVLEAKKRLKTDERTLIRREWEELKMKCKKHNDSMGAFVGRGVYWDSTPEKLISSFGDKKITLYKHLNYSIPLFELLLEHMHEYNKAHPKNKIEVDDGAASEKMVGKFINVLKQSKEKIYLGVVIRRILMLLLVFGIVIMIIAL